MSVKNLKRTINKAGIISYDFELRPSKNGLKNTTAYRRGERIQKNIVKELEKTEKKH